MHSPKPLRIGFICFRLHDQVAGGAERYIIRLARELAGRGHEISVLTTEADALSQPDRWRVEWYGVATGGAEVLQPTTGVAAARPTHLRRLPIFLRKPPFFLARWLQHFWEDDQQRRLDALVQLSRSGGAPALCALWSPSEGNGAAPPTQPWQLGPGWQLPEFTPNGAQRWSTVRSLLLGNPAHGAGHLIVRGYTPRPCRLRLIELAGMGGSYDQEEATSGFFEVVVHVPQGRADRPALYALECSPPLSPRGEARRLGVLVQQVLWKPDATADSPDMPPPEPMTVPLHETFTEAQEALPAKAVLEADAAYARRHARMARWFDVARGPNVWGIGRAIRQFAKRQDVLVFAAMPFASVNWARHAAGSSARIFHLPFRHANDPYYHWPSYTETLKQAEGILLLSSRELDGMPDDVRAKGHVISGGVDLPIPPPEWLSDEERAKLKDELGIASHSTMVLFVGRKSPSKGYLELNEGVRLANQRLGWVEAAPGEASIPPPFLLVLAGPDEDGIQLRDRHVMLAGIVSESMRDKLYRAADLFGFLSQSESFGLVMLEAWAAGCVVLAGRRSAQVTEVAATLGAPTTAPEAQSVAEALLSWRSTPTAVRQRRWQAGYNALRTQFTWWATAERFERAVE